MHLSCLDVCMFIASQGLQFLLDSGIGDGNNNNKRAKIPAITVMTIFFCSRSAQVQRKAMTLNCALIHKYVYTYVSVCVRMFACVLQCIEKQFRTRILAACSNLGIVRLKCAHFIHAFDAMKHAKNYDMKQLIFVASQFFPHTKHTHTLISWRSVAFLIISCARKKNYGFDGVCTVQITFKRVHTMCECKVL